MQQLIAVFEGRREVRRPTDRMYRLILLVQAQREKVVEYQKELLEFSTEVRPNHNPNPNPNPQTRPTTDTQASIYETGGHGRAGLMSMSGGSAVKG